MFLDLKLLAKAEYLALFKTRFHARHCGYVLFFTAVYLAMWTLVACGRALDHLLFPGFRQQQVNEPVFIIAPPRSGTTLLQKLLCQNCERFVHNALYQTIFPAVIFQRCFDWLRRFDQKLGRPVARIAHWAERQWFGGWDDLHKLRFTEPEEDDGFFVYTFLTEAIFLLFLHVNELWEAGFHDALPLPKRRKAMRFYRSCLQRRLYVSGPNKTMLCKATQSSGAVEALLAEFPNAKFITILRDPCESIASHVSVFWSVWIKHSPSLKKDGPEAAAYAMLAVRWYQHLAAFGKKVNPKQFYCVDYEELTRDPALAVKKLYGHFGWQLSPDFQAKLLRDNQRQHQFRSRHRYSLEEFGLTEEWLQNELGPSFHFTR